MRALETIFDLIAPYDCLGCGQEGPLVCRRCWPRLVSGPPFSCAITSYQGLAKQLVRHMKIDCRRQACYLIAQALHEWSPPCPPSTCITAVPTAPARVRERGFDHAQTIAQEFARLRGLPYKQLLIRHGRAKQAGMTPEQRREQVKRAYQLHNKAPPKNVLIIDDVMTTGTTMATVTEILRQAGVVDASTLVFAQA